MHAPVPPAFCRVTVLAPARRVDLALPVDVPVAEVVPMLLELVGEPSAGAARPDPWRLTGAAGGPLRPDATLLELGVVDGELLRLGPDAPPPPPTVFDDPVDALATLAAPTGAPDRPRRVAAAVVGVTAAAAALLATTPTDGGSAAGAVAMAGAAAIGALGRAGWAARHPTPPNTRDDGGRATRIDPPPAALVPAACAVPLAAAAGWVTLPGPPDAAHLLLAVVAAGLAAVLGQVAVRAVVPVLAATVVGTAFTGAAALVAVRFGTATPALAAVTGAVALSLGPLAPRAALRLAGVARPVVPTDAAGLVAADAGPDLLSTAALARRARLARDHLVGVSGGCAVVAAGAAPLAATAGGWAGRTLAAVLVTALLLRSRGFADPAPGRVHLAAGIAAGVVLVGLAATAPDGPGRPLGALVLLAAAAVGAGGLRRATPLSPVARRALDVGEGVLTAAAIPLALAAAGLLAIVRAL